MLMSDPREWHRVSVQGRESWCLMKAQCVCVSLCVCMSSKTKVTVLCGASQLLQWGYRFKRGVYWKLYGFPTLWEAVLVFSTNFSHACLHVLKGSFMLLLGGKVYSGFQLGHQ